MILSKMFIFSRWCNQAYKDKIYVERIMVLKVIFKILMIVQTSFPEDGDTISAKIPNGAENKVSVTGRVLPGDYSLVSNKTIKDLIISANGFTRDALTSRAFLFRKNGGVNDELISINLNDADEIKTRLQVLDSLVVNSKKDITPERFVEVVGEVLNDTILPFKNNMSIIDAIIMSGGFSDIADKENVQVFRNSSTKPNDKLTEVINVKVNEDYTSENNIILNEGDLSLLVRIFKRIKYFLYKRSSRIIFCNRSENQSINEFLKK